MSRLPFPPIRYPVLFAVLLSAGACRAAPLTAPSGSAITLAASATTLPIDGASDITAFLMEGALGGGTGAGGREIIPGGGAPVHDGTEVYFTTSLGRIEPAEARTSRGRATARLVTDGRSGTATVTAMSGAASASVDIVIGAAAAARMSVTASPQTLPPGGGTSTIAARVEDANGNGVGGAAVAFTTSRGTVTPASAVTGSDGVARATLATTADATVTASGGGSSGASGSVIVTVRKGARIGLTPPAAAMLGVPATFTVTPAADTPVAEASVDFGDGTSVTLGAIAAATSLSHLFRKSGELTVRARAIDDEGHETSVATRVAVLPLAATGAALSTPRAGDRVTFIVTPAAGASIDRYRWEFGDGVVRTTSGGEATYMFSTPGRRTVSVRVYPFASSEYSTVLIPVDVQR